MESDLKKHFNNLPEYVRPISNTDHYYSEIDLNIINRQGGKRECPGCGQDFSIEYQEVLSTRQHLLALILCFCWYEFLSRYEFKIF